MRIGQNMVNVIQYKQPSSLVIAQDSEVSKMDFDKNLFKYDKTIFRNKKGRILGWGFGK